MASFAERHGYREPRTIIQIEDLDDETRIRLWNTFAPIASYRLQAVVDSALEDLWVQSWNKSHDEMPVRSQMWRLIKAEVLQAEWWRVFDLIEALVGWLYPRGWNLDEVRLLPANFNSEFERCLVGWRFIDQKIAPLDSKVDVEAINSAQVATEPLVGARQHLDRAIALLSDRVAPNYKGSVGQSLSAVEAVVRHVTGARTLGDGLKALEEKHITIHPALKNAWLKMYGWASDAEGIRHGGGTHAADVNQALAKYMLIACSAFVSYVIEQGGTLEG